MMGSGAVDGPQGTIGQEYLYDRDTFMGAVKDPPTRDPGDSRFASQKDFVKGHVAVLSCLDVPSLLFSWCLVSLPGSPAASRPMCSNCLMHLRVTGTLRANRKPLDIAVTVL